MNITWSCADHHPLAALESVPPPPVVHWPRDGTASSPANHGLPEFDFKRLFLKCTCGLVMTCRVFEVHTCTIAGIVSNSCES